MPNHSFFISTPIFFHNTVNIYGFKRLKTGGKATGSYTHPLLVRGNPDICRYMVRTKIKNKGIKNKQNKSPSNKKDHSVTGIITSGNSNVFQKFINSAGSFSPGQPKNIENRSINNIPSLPSTLRKKFENRSIMNNVEPPPFTMDSLGVRENISLHEDLSLFERRKIGSPVSVSSKHDDCVIRDGMFVNSSPRTVMVPSIYSRLGQFQDRYCQPRQTQYADMKSTSDTILDDDSFQSCHNNNIGDFSYTSNNHTGSLHQTESRDLYRSIPRRVSDEMRFGLNNQSFENNAYDCDDILGSSTNSHTTTGSCNTSIDVCASNDNSTDLLDSSLCTPLSADIDDFDSDFHMVDGETLSILNCFIDEAKNTTAEVETRRPNAIPF